MNNVNHLIISNRVDYSTDLICLEMENRGLNYLRLNRDQFAEYLIEYTLGDNALNVLIENDNYVVTQKNLRSVFFRAPVFLRSTKVYNLEEQLYRSQWGSFIRNLVVFDRCKWMNHPVDTYRAENKMYQLKKARDVGLLIPETVVSNFRPLSTENKKRYIVKSLDTALFRDGDHELFTYSSVLQGSHIVDQELRAAPVIIQEYLTDKVDIRVTAVDNTLHSVKITKNGNGVDGDWRRLSKDSLEYTSIRLPLEIEEKIIALMRLLNLSYGGIDLAFCRDKYYFIEVNPTGEWGWLYKLSEPSLDVAIVDCLVDRDAWGKSHG